MKKTFTILLVLMFSVFLRLAEAQTVVFSEDFETGTAKAAWGTYYAGEDSVKAKPMSAAPKPLTGGGNYVGLLQDINGSYTGSAVSAAGALNLQNYSIEADVYCYVNQALSA
ncbi:MAG: hypothetical protein NTV54_12755 [Ignavibacteriales bacterium]|nr:hypothetical protein [Ignavibacteriales bacterium]